MAAYPAKDMLIERQLQQNGGNSTLHWTRQPCMPAVLTSAPLDLVYLCWLNCPKLCLPFAVVQDSAMLSFTARI